MTIPYKFQIQHDKNAIKFIVNISWWDESVHQFKEYVNNFFRTHGIQYSLVNNIYVADTLIWYVSEEKYILLLLLSL